MDDPIDFDPALLAGWPLAGSGGLGPGDAGSETRRAVEALLETKAGPDPAEALHLLLNEMTDEMRRQFEVFRAIRAGAERTLGGDDEAAAKIAKADVKAATDALSLIVRTIEKIDSLQRSLAHDRELAAENAFDQSAYDAMLADIERKIEARTEERLQIRLAEAGLAGLPGTGPPGLPE